MTKRTGLFIHAKNELIARVSATYDKLNIENSDTKMTTIVTFGSGKNPHTISIFDTGKHVSFKYRDDNFRDASTIEEVDETLDRLLGGRRVTFDFLDYEIVNCGNSDGYVLTKKIGAIKKEAELWESHLGNFTTLEDAKKAAVHYFMIARPADFATQIYMRIGVGKKATQTCHDYFKFLEVLKRESIECPPEITQDTSFTEEWNELANSMTRISGSGSELGFNGTSI